MLDIFCDVTLAALRITEVHKLMLVVKLKTICIIKMPQLFLRTKSNLKLGRAMLSHITT